MVSTRNCGSWGTSWRAMMLMPILRSTASRIDSRLPISNNGPYPTPAFFNISSVSLRVVEPASRISKVCPTSALNGT
ncbi:hypothetical protein SRABI66_04295 [Stenotrophomonas lactitubi]|nr:hypothetical protein SRABI66_04295 [Stenotrophomonas lactitubi]